MDKAYSKIIFEKAKISQAEYIYLKRRGNEYVYIDHEFNEKIYELKEIARLVKDKLSFPVFVKPSNSGSSVGIKKAHDEIELMEAIENASLYDVKVLIEEAIKGREVECAVFGKNNVLTTCVGEILPAEEFYTFDAKYKNEESRVIIPADISEQISDEIRKTAEKAFKAVDGSGLARVDFFVEDKTNRIIINEINTMPGFTQISMYPKLWEKMGYSYSKLLDGLIELAFTKLVFMDGGKNGKIYRE